MKSPERIPLQSLFAGGKGQLEEIAEAVDRGALFVYPTETIYGIGGRCDAPGMVEKILLAKRRAPENPLITIAPDITFFKALPVVFPPAAVTLAERFWPGMLTLILPSPSDPRGLAIRACNHPFIVALFKHTSMPVFSTSANTSGEAYVNNPDLIFRQFSSSIEFMIDAGPLPPSRPSTVVRVGEDDTVALVREGAIPFDSISEYLLKK